MKTDSNKQTINPELTPAEDQLMDSLLREFADRGTADDDAFLAKAEAALDAGEHLTVAEKSDSEPDKTTKRRLVSPFWFPAGIAAGLAVGVFAAGLLQKTEEQEPDLPVAEKPELPTHGELVAVVDPEPVVAMPWRGTISVPYEAEVIHRSSDIGASYANTTFPDAFDQIAIQDQSIGGTWYYFAEVDEDVGELTLDPSAVVAAGAAGSGGRVDFAGQNILIPQPGDVNADGGTNGGNVVAGTSNNMFIDGTAGSNFTTGAGASGLVSPDGELRAHGSVGAMAVENTGAVRSTVPDGQITLRDGDPLGMAVQINGTLRSTTATNEGGRIVLSGGDAPASIGHGGRQHPGHGQVAPIQTGTRFTDAALPVNPKPELTATLGGAVEASPRGGFVGRDASLVDERGRSRRKIADEIRGTDFRDVGPKGEADFAEDPIAGRRNAEPNDRERYGELIDNEFLSPLTDPLSTFSIDVDTASYTNLRRMITDGTPIPKDSVRIEEMINYFSYNYPQPDGEHPFGLALEAAECPWAADHQLLRVGIQGKSMDRDERPASNLVFLLDVSGSMNDSRKLPLVKQSIAMLVEELDDRDTVSIVVYAGAEGLALSATPGSDQKTILESLNRLKSGGSTNGGAGIKLAYKLAKENFIEDGINRVLLCTDGDFNVGTTGQGDLVELVSNEAESGVFLSVLGFGNGNINDSMLEAITNDGNGVYYYVDSQREARKVFLEEIMGTLVTIAKDVKIQIEFNPAKVQSYRLIGYANRMLEAEDFEDDTVDAGEIGAGHQVTALYEIVPVDVEIEDDAAAKPREAPELEFQRLAPALIPSEKLAVFKLRYKQPDGDVSTEIRESIENVEREWQHTSDDFQFASGVALFGMMLRDSKFSGEGTFAEALELATEGTGVDPHGRRAEFQQLLRKAMDQAARNGRGAAAGDDGEVEGGVSISVSF